MKKFLMLAAAVVLVAAVLALPALARDFNKNGVGFNVDQGGGFNFDQGGFNGFSQGDFNDSRQGDFLGFFDNLSRQDLNRLDRFFSNNSDNFDNFDNSAGVSQGFNQEIEDTGNVTLNTSVSSSGDNSNQCVAPLQFGNTGNVQNAQGFLQYNSTSDDIEFEGSSMTFSPTLRNTCDQSVQQAAAAG